MQSPDGAIFGLGWIDQVDGWPRRHLVKLAAYGTGAVDETWNPSPDQQAKALAVDAAGRVYVGGWFTDVGGQQRHRLARLSGTGTGAADETWNPGTNHPVEALHVGTRGTVYVGGMFTQFGGQPRMALAALPVNADWIFIRGDFEHPH